jgi:hypothetical protein
MSEYSGPVEVAQYQPTLPAEVEFSDIENLFLDEQPKNLWPKNQNSNLGAIRKVVSDLLQDGLSTLDELALEHFVSTSLALGYLGRWEAEVGLPVAPGSVTEAVRRALVLGRLQKGAYTRARRNEIIENHIVATFGQPLELTPSGLLLGAGGLPLFSAAGVVSELYRIYEDTRNFYFEIRIDTDVDPNFDSLLREIGAITPAWLDFDITEYVNVLDYQKRILHLQPVWYSRFHGNADDISGYANHGTLVGSPASVSAPGLLVIPGNQAYLFNGSSQNATFPLTGLTSTLAREITLEAWIQPVALPTGTGVNQYAMVFADQANANYLALVAPGNPMMSLMVGGVQRSVTAPSPLTAGAIKKVTGTFDGTMMRLFVDGVQVAESGPWVGDLSLISANWYIGRYISPTYYFNGAIDEPAVYNRVLSAAENLENFNTGKNIP